MRTKTLLLAAAVALAAGILTSSAQVYSANVVGYITMVVPANGYQVMANTLINGSDANATNNNINVAFTNGFVSSPVPATIANPNQNPALSSNTVFYAWNGSSFGAYYFFNAADATSWEGSPSPGGWYNGAGAPAVINLNQGQAAFIFNHSSGAITNTFVGTVLQGTNTASTIQPGYNFIALQEPISTNPIVSGYGLPGTLTSSNDLNNANDIPTPQSNDAIYVWNGSSFGAFYFFNQADATYWENGGASSPVFPAGFYNSAGSPMPNSAYPVVNQGFFLYHTGSAITWTNGFVVQ
jgi:hypothetical protein